MAIEIGSWALWAFCAWPAASGGWNIGNSRAGIGASLRGLSGRGGERVPEAILDRPGSEPELRLRLGRRCPVRRAVRGRHHLGEVLLPEEPPQRLHQSQ